MAAKIAHRGEIVKRANMDPEQLEDVLAHKVRAGHGPGPVALFAVPGTRDAVLALQTAD